MPRRSVFSSVEREMLLSFATDEAEMIRIYTLSVSDQVLIRERRGDANRLGFALQLCCLRYPGTIWNAQMPLPPEVAQLLATQLNISANVLDAYARRDQTRRKHLAEIALHYGYRPLSSSLYQESVEWLAQKFVYDRSLRPGDTFTLASYLLLWWRSQQIIVPSVTVVDRLCTEAITLGQRRIYILLYDALSSDVRKHLEGLLVVSSTESNTDESAPQTKRDRGAAKGAGRATPLRWLRQPPGAPTARMILEHMERLQAILNLGLPETLGQNISAQHLTKMAREAGPMSAKDIGRFELVRRMATLAALMQETRATLIDEIVDLNDCCLGVALSRAKRIHQEQFATSGKAIKGSAHETDYKAR